MKRFRLLFLVALAAILMSSCTGCMGCTFKRVSFEELSPKDYPHFVVTLSGQTGYSPQAYTVLKGYNPANDYNWNQVTIRQYSPEMFKYVDYIGDEGRLVLATYPDADTILSYGGCYYVGYKKKP